MAKIKTIEELEKVVKEEAKKLWGAYSEYSLGIYDYILCGMNAVNLKMTGKNVVKNRFKTEIKGVEYTTVHFETKKKVSKRKVKEQMYYVRYCMKYIDRNGESSLLNIIGLKPYAKLYAWTGIKL